MLNFCLHILLNSQIQKINSRIQKIGKYMKRKKNNTYQIMISNYHAKTATKKINNFILELI